VLRSQVIDDIYGFYTLSGLSSHRKKTCRLRVRCIPAPGPGAGSRVTGMVLLNPTRGLPVTNPRLELKKTTCFVLRMCPPPSQQLEFCKFDTSDPYSATSASWLHIRLTPKAITDPYTRSSHYARESSSHHHPHTHPLL